MSVKVEDAFEMLVSTKSSLSVVGLGYVGLPLAQAFSEKGIDVIGYDSNQKKIDQYRKGEDPTNEVGEDRLTNSTIDFTSDIEELRNAMFHIIAVPTPIYEDKLPDFRPLENASKDVGSVLKKGDYVVYESTVYPGLTRELCIPILEKSSGLKCPNDFKVGYSPERINPGDKENTLQKIVKVVSGVDKESLELISRIYDLIIDAGVHKAESIEIAEASKIIENAQRDVNIAFMNEISKIFNKMNISTNSVLEAASTKWNFLNFKPGLVGGHCIGIDPYYLIYKAKKEKISTQLLESCREVNDGMSDYIVQEIIKGIFTNKFSVANINIGILGISFKEDTPDLRNSKTIEIVNKLNEYGITPLIHDPVIDSNSLYQEESLINTKLSDFKEIDVLIIAVPHQEIQKYSVREVSNIMRSEKSIVFDLKSKFLFLRETYSYWSL
ncbi:nucleotide sugar dehydrogenase [Erysipelothrix anatis]|uniref:nucleotide sugar dehydrogenase n=1 Tax=Erysipelothrix anatis TaxID=2683713 RepID=UPI00135AE28A|nr:nucleotide sugar dehydrogenase [Erysipelothrix anatis]